MQWTDFLEPRTAEGRVTSGRTEFERDQDRVIFSSPFRRLNDKTQVLPIPEHYFVHNRMTHSIETSCVGRSLGHVVGQSVLEDMDPDWSSESSRELGSLVQAACLAHDIGNPPFGHSGEDAISSFFQRRGELLSGLGDAERRDFTAFEGNAQGFRIISSLSPGLRLTSNTLAAFTKYPKESVVEGGYARPEDEKRRDQKKYGAFQSERAILEGLMAATGLPRLSERGLAFARHPFAFLVEAADDVCYLIIDLEDAVRLDIIGLREVEDALVDIIGANPDSRSRSSQSEAPSGAAGAASGAAGGSANGSAASALLGDGNDRVAHLRARAINSLIFQCAAVFGERLAAIAAGEYQSSLTAEIPSAAALRSIQKVSEERLYRYKPVLEIEAAGFEVLGGILDMITEAAFHERDARARARLDLFPELRLGPGLSRYEALRRITDYVSGMTDSFALSTYRKLRGVELPRMY
jgi:dGTPase